MHVILEGSPSPSTRTVALLRSETLCRDHMVPAQRRPVIEPGQETASTAHSPNELVRATSDRVDRVGSSMRSLIRNLPLLGRGIACSRENGWPARTTGFKAPSRIAGGHVARVCGYQGSTEATLQQSKTPHSTCPSHGTPPHVPIGVRPVDGAAR